MEPYHGKKEHKPEDQMDRDAMIYQEGFNKGLEHASSSKETLDRIAKSKEEIKVDCDKSYAIKLVERIVFGFVALILIAAAGAWIALIIKKI